VSPELSSLAPHSISKPFQHLRVECLINSVPFWYRFKVDDTTDVAKADQHYFDLELLISMVFFLPGDSPETVFNTSIMFHSVISAV
jgi:hypothetical protein